MGSLYGFQVAKQATLNPTNLFSTIARHLAEQDPIRKQLLIDIIRKADPITRATMSPTDQFEKFLLPLLSPPNSKTPLQPTVLVIDAFDECGNLGNRRELLNILTTRAHEFPATVRLIVTSRYEEDVQKALESRTSDLCLLKMEQIPKDSTKQDIYSYVHATLKDVSGLGSSQYASDLTTLAIAAEQSFQWASTACLFIKNEDDQDGGMSPKRRLKQVLRSNKGLDQLYHTIFDQKFALSNLENLQLLRIILGCLVCAQEPLSLRAIISLGTEQSATFDPEFDPDDYHRLARKLSSLVTGTQNLDTPLIALHTSFTDFLGDKARSSEKYSVDPVAFHQHLAAGCLHTMSAELRFNLCGLSTSFMKNKEIENIDQLIGEHISESLSYACRFWPYHLCQLDNWAEVEMLRGSVARLLNDRVLEWLEVMSTF